MKLISVQSRGDRLAIVEKTHFPAHYLRQYKISLKIINGRFVTLNAFYRNQESKALKAAEEWLERATA